jgi:hypothetical protein
MGKCYWSDNIIMRKTKTYRYNQKHNIKPWLFKKLIEKYFDFDLKTPLWGTKMENKSNGLLIIIIILLFIIVIQAGMLLKTANYIDWNTRNILSKVSQ